MTPPTQNDISEALHILSRDYYSEVKDLARAWLDTKKWAQDNRKAFDAHETLRQILLGSSRMAYALSAKIGLLVSQNEDAYQDDHNEPPPTPQIAMYYALREDVLEILGDEYMEDK